MRFLTFAGLVVLALVAQVTVANFIQVWGIRPDLIMILIIMNGFLRGIREGAFLGFMAGLLKDVVTGNFLGAGALSGLVAGCAAGYAESRLFKENLIIVMGLIWFISFLGQLVSYILLSMAGLGLSLFIGLFKVIIPASTYNALLGIVFYRWYYRSVQRGLLS